MVFHGPTAVAVLVDLTTGGAVYYLLSSVLYNTCAPIADPLGLPPSKAALKAGCPPGEDVFKKPYFVNLLVYLSVSCSLLIYLAITFTEARAARKAGSLAKFQTSWGFGNFGVVCVPGILHGVSGVLTYVAALFVPGSVVLLIKGTRIVFSAILSLFLLPNKRMYAYHWVGVALAKTGVLLVGVSEVMNGFKGSSDVFIGLAIALVGEFIRALHLVSVEVILKVRHKLHPMFVTGAKGVWGLSFVVIVLMVVSYGITDSSGRPYEGLSDTLFMVQNSPAVVGILVVLFVLFIAADIGAMFITKYLSAVHNSLSSVMRGMLIWGVELAVFYSGLELYGEAWGRYSWAKALGFLAVGVATFIFNGTLKLPGFFYPEGKSKGPDSNVSRETSLNKDLSPIEIEETGKR